MTNEQKTEAPTTDVIRGMEQAIEMADGKTKAPEQSDMVDVLIRALEGAERVVVETPNALGEMDAHYLHAPELLTAWNTRTDLAQAATDKAVADALKEAAMQVGVMANGAYSAWRADMKCDTHLEGKSDGLAEAVEVIEALIPPEQQEGEAS
jgi:hypothetical protein